MDFGLSEDQGMFQEALRGYLAEHCPIERVRRTMETEDARDDRLLEGIAAQGVAGILVPEAYGGLGLTLLDAAIAMEELGRAAVPCSGHSSYVAAPLAIAQAGSEAQKSRWLSTIVSGQVTVSFADGAPSVANGKLNGSVKFVPDATSADAFVLVCGEAEERRLVLLPRDTPGLRFEGLRTVDETRRVGELTFEDVTIDADVELAMPEGSKVLEEVLDAGRIALAADALGGVERTLADAVEYSLTRKQFGRVIGSFQAVKHMCAEVYAALEPVRSLLWYAAFASQQRYPDAHEVALLLKAEATEVATEGVSTCVQVFGGMGFTWECDAQLWFKRAGYDRQMLGGPEALRSAAVAEVL